MIPFPKYIRLGGHLVTIKMVSGLVKEEQAFGTWDDGSLTISIDSALSSSLTWDTIFHEMTESINTLADLSLTHQTITTIALLFHQGIQSMFEEGQEDA